MIFPRCCCCEEVVGGGGADDVITAERDTKVGAVELAAGVCAGEALQGPLAAKAVSFTESDVRCCEAIREAAGPAAPPPPLGAAAVAAAEAPPPPPPPPSAARPPTAPLLREESWRVSMLHIFEDKSIFRGMALPKPGIGILRRLSLRG